MLRRRSAQPVMELPIVMIGLMNINAKLDKITRLLAEDDDGEEAEEF